jgi:hypothetical protein
MQATFIFLYISHTQLKRQSHSSSSRIPSLYNHTTNSTRHSSSSEANSSSDSQEIPHIFTNPKLHCCFHDSLPFVPTLSQIKPIHAPHPIFWRYILISSSHLCLGLASCLFHSGFPTKTSYAFLFSSIHDTCSVHLSLLHLIVLVVPAAIKTFTYYF